MAVDSVSLNADAVHKLSIVCRVNILGTICTFGETECQ